MSVAEYSPAQDKKAKPVAIAIIGPTAIGKTAVAIELVKLLNGKAEVLSVDSVQVYRSLNIGAAKPSAAERSEAAFHLIDLVEPDEPFTLANYQEAAVEAAWSIERRGNLAILCGGTGLYYRALTQPLGLPPVPPDQSFREMLLRDEQEHGAGTLHARLKALDEDAAARIHPNDVKRLSRALEVILHTRQKISDLHQEDAKAGEPLISCVRCFAMNCDRAALYRRIERRVDEMMSAGFLDEVRSLRERGYSPGLRAMRTLGYAELNDVLDGNLHLDAAVALIKQHTRNFAKRQLIWFRADPRLIWLDTPPELSPAAIAETIAASLSDG